MYCSKMTPLEHMCRHVKQLIREGLELPKVCFKQNVVVDLKEYGPTECFAIYAKEFIQFLHDTVPESRIYSKEQIHGQVKKESRYGEVCKNVAFRTSQGIQIRRAIVICKGFLT